MTPARVEFGGLKATVTKVGYLATLRGPWNKR